MRIRKNIKEWDTSSALKELIAEIKKIDPKFQKQELAELAGVTNVTLSNWLAGTPVRKSNLLNLKDNLKKVKNIDVDLEFLQGEQLEISKLTKTSLSDITDSFNQFKELSKDMQKFNLNYPAIENLLNEILLIFPQLEGELVSISNAHLEVIEGKKYKIENEDYYSNLNYVTFVDNGTVIKISGNLYRFLLNELINNTKELFTISHIINTTANLKLLGINEEIEIKELEN